MLAGDGVSHVFQLPPTTSSGSPTPLSPIVHQFPSSHQPPGMMGGTWSISDGVLSPPLPGTPNLARPPHTLYSPQAPGLLFICTEKDLFFNKEGLYFPVDFFLPSPSPHTPKQCPHLQVLPPLPGGGPQHGQEPLPTSAPFSPERSTGAHPRCHPTRNPPPRGHAPGGCQRLQLVGQHACCPQAASLGPPSCGEGTAPPSAGVTRWHRGVARPAVPARLPSPSTGVPETRGPRRVSGAGSLPPRHLAPSIPVAGHPPGRARRGGGEELARRESTAGTAWGTCRCGWPCLGRCWCRVSRAVGLWDGGAGGSWALTMGLGLGGDGGRVQAGYVCPHGCVLGTTWQGPVTEHPLCLPTQSCVLTVCVSVCLCALCHCICVPACVQVSVGVCARCCCLRARVCVPLCVPVCVHSSSASLNMSLHILVRVRVSMCASIYMCSVLLRLHRYLVHVLGLCPGVCMSLCPCVPMRPHVCTTPAHPVPMHHTWVPPSVPPHVTDVQRPGQLLSPPSLPCPALAGHPCWGRPSNPQPPMALPDPAPPRRALH